MTVTDNTTEQQLRSMLTTSTGIHMLDSGGDTGRMWQRNQVKDELIKGDWDSLPEGNVSGRWDLEVTLDLYHWLKKRLEYCEPMEEQFTEYADKYPDAGWPELMQGFAEDIRDGTGLYGDGVPQCINTYNYDQILSQVIQFVLWNDPHDGSTYVLLQVHNGADVRGGYTSPSVFEFTGWDDSEMYDFSRASVRCTECDAYWYTDDGYHFYPENTDIELKELKGIEITEYFYDMDDIHAGIKQRMSEGEEPFNYYLYNVDTDKVTCPCCNRGTLEAGE